ncbi:Coenzyme F420-reducing hydrogenase, beta subunit [Zobellia uliginosa]|uniref:Coenzyme F420-reducing hydrogenase, beta subunit n=1 Tax=Zobellia uliginosa TaxID=143224 RepID=A0ABY1KJT4_9FLAO|nr:Coenzyme F420 hydrogenase/dehydrogenase, beta subunit C-terminal domain [Zobellia uliginosa]SIS42636.1 Coenzyme F420-reducing hydrogenase, beta subunit [Zobellia uliginosa]
MTADTKKGSLEKVVSGGYCTGCGACAYATSTKMSINEYGEYIPDLSLIEKKDQKTIEKAEFVCPSLNPSFNEDVLASTFLGRDNDKSSEYIGPYQNVYGGYVVESDYRNRGTSGGFGTYIGAALFENGMIDGVIHVKEAKRNNASDPFFKYGISTTLDEIQNGARTKYHVIELSGVLNLIHEKPGKYLLIGVPCMIKAIRRVQLQDSYVKESIKYTLALVCGHLKSVNWTLSLAWGKGITPEKATKFKYRTKGEGIPARAYVFTAYSDAQEIVEDSGNVIGGKFNQGALMLEACDFCDDVVGETADITVGDAWLPQFEIDAQGTNMLIIRNKEINSLLEKCIEEKKVNLVNLTEEDAKYAQAGGFRQRREGLSYRLHKKDKSNKWRPEKRVAANSYKLSPLRKTIYTMRSDVTKVSRVSFHRALKTNNYSIYQRRMKSTLKRLRMLEVASSAPRIISKKIAYIRLKNNI